MRKGNFTSSEIWKLTTVSKDKVSFGKPALTYIAEKRMERRLGRPLSSFTSSKPTSWGNLCERQAFERLGIDYSLNSKDVLTHPEIDYWKGTPDGFRYENGKPVAVVDIKSPFTLKSFCELVDANDINVIRDVHDCGEDYYWQLVSNAVLSGLNKAELIIYCPYLSEIQDLKDWSENIDDLKQWQYKWINSADIDELPYLPDGGYYKNLNIIPFEVSEADKELLIAKVLAAGELLNQ